MKIDLVNPMMSEGILMASIPSKTLIERGVTLTLVRATVCPLGHQETCPESALNLETFLKTMLRFTNIMMSTMVQDLVLLYGRSLVREV